MKKIILLTAIVIAVLAACHTTKKTSTTETKTTPVATTPTEPTKTSFSVFSGSALPGEPQVNAIQLRNPGTTLEMLTKGHSIYTGECSGCHRVFSVYDYSAEAWTPIIDRMSIKAGLTEGQKDALSRYIFSMKATQQNGK